jgi:hypothetical protein
VGGENGKNGENCNLYAANVLRLTNYSLNIQSFLAMLASGTTVALEQQFGDVTGLFWETLK